MRFGASAGRRGWFWGAIYVARRTPLTSRRMNADHPGTMPAKNQTSRGGTKMAGKAARATVSSVESGGRLAIKRLELTARQTRRAGEIIAASRAEATAKPKAARRASRKRATA
jgi:type II secretory pathway component HofQ